jgi:hypothetical protein
VARNEFSLKNEEQAQSCSRTEKKIGISRLETKELRVTDELLASCQKTASGATPL